MRNQFTFYASFWEAVRRLRKDRDRLSAYDAICTYALTGEEIQMTDAAEALLYIIRPVLDAAARKSAGRTNREVNDKDNAERPGQDTSKTEPRPDQDNGNKNKNKDKNKDKDKKKSYAPPTPSSPPKFTPPTLEEVEAYVRERGSPVDPVRFWEYFETGGWKDAKGQPVRNWKQKLLTWEEFQPKKPQPSGREALEELWEEYKADGSAGMGELPEWIDSP